MIHEFSKNLPTVGGGHSPLTPSLAPPPPSPCPILLKNTSYTTVYILWCVFTGEGGGGDIFTQI